MPVKDVFSMPHPTGGYYSKGIRPIYYNDLLLGGDNGLLAKAQKAGIEVSEEIVASATEIDSKLPQGFVNPAVSLEEYLIVLDLYRKTGQIERGTRTKEPSRELAVASDLDVSQNLRLYMPEDFKQAFLVQLASTFQKMQSFPERLEEDIISYKEYQDDPEDALMLKKLEELKDTIKIPSSLEEANQNALKSTTFYPSEFPTGRAALLHYSMTA